MKAVVTQYLRPNGQKQTVETTLPDEVLNLYNEMIAADCRFEAEVLTTEQVSTSITSMHGDEGEPMDIDSRITPNGPEVQQGMIAMLKAKRWEAR